MFSFLRKKSKCPYCFEHLEDQIIKSGQCNHCKNKFVTVVDFRDHKKKIFTLEQAITYTNEKKLYFDANTFLFSLETICNRKKIETTFTKAKRRLVKELHREPSYAEIVWETAEIFVEETTRTGDTTLLAGLYFRMAYYLYTTGEDYSEMMILAKNRELLDYKKMGFYMAVEIGAANCCEQCSTLNRKIILFVIAH